MMTSEVTPSREALVPLRVRGPEGQETEVNAVLDTGFTGYLLLPPSTTEALALPFRNADRARLADGSIVEVGLEVGLYEGTVLWDGEGRGVLVYAAHGDPLLGMSLLYGCGVYLPVIDGGVVTIETLM